MWILPNFFQGTIKSLISCCDECQHTKKKLKKIKKSDKNIWNSRFSWMHLYAVGIKPNWFTSGSSAPHVFHKLGKVNLVYSCSELLFFHCFFFVVAAGVNHNGWRLSVQSLHEQCIESPRCGPGVWCSESGHVQAGLLLHECWRSLAHLSTMIKWQMLCEVTLCPGELLMACTGFWPDPQWRQLPEWCVHSCFLLTAAIYC